MSVCGVAWHIHITVPRTHSKQVNDLVCAKFESVWCIKLHSELNFYTVTLNSLPRFQNNFFVKVGFALFGFKSDKFSFCEELLMTYIVDHSKYLISQRKLPTYLIMNELKILSSACLFSNFNAFICSSLFFFICCHVFMHVMKKW